MILIRIMFAFLMTDVTGREQTLNDSHARKNNIKFTYRLVEMYTHSIRYSRGLGMQMNVQRRQIHEAQCS